MMYAGISDVDCLGDCPGNGRFVCTKYDSCILPSKQCDGIKDCPDGLDESNCSE